MHTAFYCYIVQARLKLEWRRFLTQQLLHAYFSHRAFFNLKLQAAGIDNPDQVLPHCFWQGLFDRRSEPHLLIRHAVRSRDLQSQTSLPVPRLRVTDVMSLCHKPQRICDDVPAFTDTSVFLVLGVIRKFFNCVAFAGGCRVSVCIPTGTMETNEQECVPHVGCHS